MEFALLGVIAVSAAFGFLLRRAIGRTAMRVILAVGLSAAAIGVTVLIMTMFRASPFDTITSGLVAAVLLSVAAVLGPFGITIACCRR